MPAHAEGAEDAENVANAGLNVRASLILIELVLNFNLRTDLR